MCLQGKHIFVAGWEGNFFSIIEVITAIIIVHEQYIDK